jgi:hypothetical protein
MSLVTWYQLTNWKLHRKKSHHQARAPQEAESEARA